MNNYLVEYETLSKLVDMLLSKKYPGQPIESLSEIKKNSIQSLDDKISSDLFNRLNDSQLTELNALLDRQEADPAIFQDYFKKAGIDLEQQVSNSIQEFSEEFLGGQNV